MRRGVWIFGLALPLLLQQTLTPAKAQRFSDVGHFRFPRPARQHVALLGGIRPSRSSVLTTRCVNPRLYFRNGFAKLRFRGRVVKYTCRPGFTIFGDSVSSCNAGRWDRPVPVCAAPGCRLPSRDLLPRGTVENVRGRGLMLRFRCRLGYTLRGGASAFCDGRSWNGSRPTCVPAVTDPDPSCDFEALDQCGWSSDLSSGVQFSRQHDSEDDDVEPVDNVTSSVGASEFSPSGHYMALESLGHPLALQDLGVPAKLVSPPYRPLRFRACFRFWYRLSCHPCSLLLLLWNSTSETALWGSTGPRKGGWANVELPKTTEDFQLVFAARTQQPGEGGVAIDDVRLGPECQEVPTAEPPPATTTLLPDDVTTEFDSGDTWDTTTTTEASTSVNQEDVAETGTNRVGAIATSTEDFPTTHGRDQRPSERTTPTTLLYESTAQPRSSQTTASVHSPSSSWPVTTPWSLAVPTISVIRGGTSGPSAAVALTTSLVTSLPTHAPPATKVSPHTSNLPTVASTYSASSSSWREIYPTTASVPTTRLVVSSSQKPSTLSAGRKPHATTASPAFSATAPRTTLVTVSGTLGPTPRRQPPTTAAWLHTTTWLRPTTWPSVYPSVEGNTVGPDVTSVKPSGSKATTAAPYTRSRTTSWRTFTSTRTEATKRTTLWLPQSTAATRRPTTRLFIARNTTTAYSTAYSRLFSTVPPTRGPVTRAFSMAQTAASTPLTKPTKPTKPRKKATELYTKPAMWTKKPTNKTEALTTSPPDVHPSTLSYLASTLTSRPAISNQSTSGMPTSNRPYSSRQPSYRSPKFVPTEDSNHVMKHVTKPPGTSSTSSARSKNDEGNDVMLNDMSAMPVLQEKHSAAAPLTGSAWMVPALLIAAGILVTVLFVATALYRCRRRYKESADDSEMKPLSKYADVDVGETSS
nr:mucin-2-like isoform X1 [Dermacentor andersoni]